MSILVLDAGALIAQALKLCRTIPLDKEQARITGRLRLASGIDDITDASVAAAAATATSLSNVVIATSDEADISLLVNTAASLRPRLVRDTIGIHPV